MKKSIAISLLVGVLLVFAVAPVYAADGGLTPLVRCGNQNYPNPCEIGDLFDMINRIIQFALFYIAIPIAVAFIVWAGILIMTSAGNGSKVTQAKQMMTGVVVGLVIAFTAWLIVETVVNVIFNP